MSSPTRGIGEKWLHVCSLLNGRGVAYVVVGSVAMALHGTIRATKDIDLLVPRDVENTKRLLEALEALPMGLARELDAQKEDAKLITIIGDDPRVDILKAAGELSYAEAAQSKETRLVNGVEIPYAALPQLIQSKRTDREEDAPDRKKLERLQGQRLMGPMREGGDPNVRPPAERPAPANRGKPTPKERDASGRGRR